MNYFYTIPDKDVRGITDAESDREAYNKIRGQYQIGPDGSEIGVASENELIESGAVKFSNSSDHEGKLYKYNTGNIFFVVFETNKTQLMGKMCYLLDGERSYDGYGKYILHYKGSQYLVNFTGNYNHKILQFDTLFHFIGKLSIDEFNGMKTAYDLFIKTEDPARKKQHIL